MDKEFDGGIGGLPNVADLVEIQLARQHDLGETGIREELRFLHAADIALGTGVQLNRWDIHLKHTHILHDQRIDAGLIQVSDQTLRRLQFIIMKNGVQGHKHLRPETVGEWHQFSDIAQAVAGIMAGAKTRAADIDRVGTMKDRFTGNGGVTSRA